MCGCKEQLNTREEGKLSGKVNRNVYYTISVKLQIIVQLSSCSGKSTTVFGDLFWEQYFGTAWEVVLN